MVCCSVKLSKQRTVVYTQLNIVNVFVKFKISKVRRFNMVGQSYTLSELSRQSPSINIRELDHATKCKRQTYLYKRRQLRVVYGSI